MNSKDYSNSARLIPFFLSVIWMFLILNVSSNVVHGQWPRHIIESNVDYSNAFDAHDIDNDGDMDLFFAQEYANRLVFYENNNNDPWSKHIIDKNAGGPVGLDLADLDDDGKMDIILGCFGADLVTWYKNDGGDPIEWVKDTIDNSYDGTVFVQAADVNGDGALDVVGRYFGSGEMVWYENKLPMDWTPHLIHPKMPSYGYFNVGDVNKDNQPDIVRAYEQGKRVVLFRNNLPDPNWTEITVDDNLITRCSHFGDIDVDGDMDIIAGAHGSNRNDMDVAWYENDGSGSNWTKHPIISTLSDATWIDLVDIDNNDTMDIVCRAEDDNLIILLMNNDGGQHWAEFTIDNQGEDLKGFYAHDIDLDGDLDLVFSSKKGGSLVWYENPLGTLHAQTLKVSPFSIQSQTDTLEVRAKVSNPENHPGQVYAVIQGDQTQYMDTLQLFDDGIHGDSISSDHLWANSTILIGLPEDEFEVDLFTYDSSYGDTLGFAAPGRFINLGPVELVEHTFVTSLFGNNTTPSPGSLLQTELKLENNSATAVATNISVELSSSNPFITFNSLHNYSTFQDIPAGETVTSSRDFWMNISNECPVDTNLAIVVNISSYEQLCWRDTFSITVSPVGIEEINAKQIKIYPNPVIDLLSIETEFSGPYFIEISSLNGQLLYSSRKVGTSHQVDLSSFHEGVYLVKIRSNDFIATRKLIKLD